MSSHMWGRPPRPSRQAQRGVLTLSILPHASRLLPCPCYGLPLDPVALRISYQHGKDERLHLLRRRKGGRRRQRAPRLSRRALLRDPEYVSLHARPRDDRPLCACRRPAKAPVTSRQRNDATLAAHV